MESVVRALTRKFQKESGLDDLRDDELFETFSAHGVVSQFIEHSFEADSLRMGEGGDLGIDAAGVIIDGDLLTEAAEVKSVLADKREARIHFIVVQAKTSQKFETKVISDLADNLEHLFSAPTLSYECSERVREFRGSIEAVYSDVGKLSPELPRLSVWYVSTGVTRASGLVESKRRRAADRLTATGRFSVADVNVLGAREITDLYRRSTDKVTATLTLDRRATMPSIPGVKQAFVGVVPAGQLVDCMLTGSNGHMRETLFYENVRDFQGYNGVNQEIRATLRDEGRRQQFVVLNNGITIVARNVVLAADRFNIRDFQIVNGCQTCNVLFSEREYLDDVFVNVRLIESQDENVIAQIVRATNQQTAVSEDDLAGREEFHRDLEDYFAHQPEGRQLYYERRSRQYTAQPDVEKLRVLTRSQIARAYAAMFLGEVPGRYQRLMESHSGRIFRRAQDPVPYYTSAASYYQLEWLLRNRGLSPYGPARYQLLAGIRLLTLGPRLPTSPKALAAACESLLDIIWNRAEALRLVESMLPAVHEARKAAERESAAAFSEIVRTKRFGEIFQRALTGSR